MPKSNLCKPKSQLANERLVRWIRGQESQKMLAEALGVTPAAVCYKIKNKSFTAEDVLKIFHFLGTEPDEIAKVMTY